MVISSCFGKVWPLTKILKDEGYDAYGLIIGNTNLEKEDISENIFSAQPLSEVERIILKINPDIIILTSSLSQRYSGKDIARKLPYYRYLTFSYGKLVHFPSEDPCEISNDIFFKYVTWDWLNLLEDILTP